ncbi:MAG: hypothetical protein JNL01_06880 [Bdellovibrionales bacterium]|nr:hypothetical protein [Bdellovibrionales bacterium]
MNLLLVFSSLAAFAAPSPTPSKGTAIFIPAPPHKIRIIWSGVAEADAYEVQTANDSRFSKEPKKYRIKELGEIAPDIKALPKFARIRGIKGNQAVTPFSLLATRPTLSPRIPSLIETTEDRVAQEWVEWQPPKDAHPDHQLMYRVRIFNSAGAILLDSLIRQNRVKPPKLPQGAYEIQVEALGDEVVGQVHIDGLGAAATVLLVKPPKR